jgi:tetratricopeptide (TPR) repeat protein
MLLACRLVLISAIFVLASVVVSAQDGILQSYLQAGLLAINEGQYTKAESLFRSAIAEISSSSLTADMKTSATIVSLNGLGLALANQQKDAEAEVVTRQLISLMERANKTTEPDYAIALNNLGLMLTKQKKFEQAVGVHRKALLLREKQLGSSHPDVAVSLLNLGKVYFDQSKFPEAEAVLDRAVAIITAIPTESQTDENMLTLATCDMNLSSIRVRQKKFTEAEQLLLVALVIRTKIQGAAHPDLIEPLRNYAILLRQTNRPVDAANIEARIRLLQSENN